MENINISSLIEHNAIVYNNKLAILTSLQHFNSELPNIAMLESAALVLIKKGHVHVSINDVNYYLTEGDIFFCTPNNILQGAMVSVDIDIMAIFVTQSFLEELTDKINIPWTFRTLVARHEVLHADETRVSCILTLTDYLRYKIAGSVGIYQETAITNVFRSMFYEIQELMEANQRPVIPPSHNAQEDIFQRFCKLLDESSPFVKPGATYLSVNEYAERLNITSKYFSSVCKKVTGKTAGTIIDEEIVKTAQKMLHDSSLNIKQIADHLGFKNQSHFGTFYRRKTGVSPQTYRESMQL